MVEVEFLYEQKNKKIQCNIDEKMEDILNKYVTQIGIDKNKIYFLYSGNKIDEELTLKEIIGVNELEIIKILVCKIKKEEKDIYIKSNNIICPKCGEISKIKMKDYRIKIYGCKNGHKINNIILDEYENRERINISKIKCDECKEKNKGNTSENKFYIFNECEINLFISGIILIIL